MEVTLLDYGATIQAIRVPTESGVVDAVLGYANFDDYLRDEFYMGATVGRFANRIAAARFSIDGKNFSVDPNEMPARRQRRFPSALLADALARRRSRRATLVCVP